MGEILFVTGGARSGKSTFAEHLVRGAAGEDGAVVYLATMEPGDAELRERIRRHQEGRPSGWRTVEEPLAIADALRAAPLDACVLLDCLSLWVTNALMQLESEDPSLVAITELEGEIDAEVGEVVRAARARSATTVLVTNEVGSGVVPPYPLGRVYRDVLGRVNQAVSRSADRAWLLVAGRPIELPPPFEPF